MGTFPNMGVAQNGWFTRENPAKIRMIWGYPYFRKPPCGYSLFIVELEVLESHSLMVGIVVLHQTVDLTYGAFQLVMGVSQ